MKIKKILKQNKMPIALASLVLVAGLAGGGYYLATKQTPKSTSDVPTTETAPTTSTEVQQNVQQKGEAATGTTTTTPAVVAEKPATTSLADVSFTILRDTDMVQAYVSFYGPVGSYGIEKLVGGSWTTLIGSFTYSGSGGRFIDTITSSDSVSHYRVFKLENGLKVASSGDTTITWQQIISSNDGTLSVPLAE